jgi:hypothetical protein
MPRPRDDKLGTCSPACTNVITFMTDFEVPPSTGISTGTYSSVDGYRHVNVFVQFSQEQPNEAPVDLGVMFAFDAAGHLGSRRYADLEENVPSPQSTNFVQVSGADAWHGSPHNVSSYIARLPVMGPFAQVFVYNMAPAKRTVSVWGYLVS